jgi:hypothetical protein
MARSWFVEKTLTRVSVPPTADCVASADRPRAQADGQGVIAKDEAMGLWIQQGFSGEILNRTVDAMRDGTLLPIQDRPRTED